MKIKVHRVNIKQNQTSFGSQNRPVKSFTINTPQGKINVSEMKTQENYSEEEIHSISKFFIDNYIEGSTNPGWKKYAKPANKDQYEKRVLSFADFLKKVLKNDDGNTTILVGKDNTNKVRAGIIGFSFTNIKGLEDSTTYYFNSMGVDKQYRGNNIGTILMKKTLNTTKGIYTDALLTGYNKALPLYSRLGFTRPDITNPQIKAVVEKAIGNSTIIPKYAKFMHKVLNPKETRWWERVFNKII